jgi:sugar/nucleoside kinase (ribokinase family)
MLDEAALQGSSLCVVGNINRDIKITPLRAGKHLFDDGETPVASILETIGGGGANSAVAAAALGARVSFFGKVGTDGMGQRLERTLTKNGVAAHLAKDSTNATGASIALAFESGHRHFISSLPASRALCFADLDVQAMVGFDHLLRADIWFSDTMLFEGNKQLFEIARRAGSAISMDLNWDPQWGHAGASEIRARKQAARQVLPWVNLAHGNVRELMEFADADDLETALKRLADWGVEVVVVHLGEKGAGYYCQGFLQVEPPVLANSQVNMTGTGDVLSVCMMLLHQRRDLGVREHLRLANTIVAEFMEGKRQLIPPLADF